MSYGYELVIDLHHCDEKTFNRGSIDRYFKRICEAINMERCERFWWDDIGVPEQEKQTLPHTKGTSAVQFILTSSIVIHTLDMLKSAYINIFSCKSFDAKSAEAITKEFFKAEAIVSHFITRT